MTGAMAGSTAIRFGVPRGRLDVLTLTINNSCNLECPHCYLQYDGPSRLIDQSLLAEVVAAQYRHLAVVGKEPLLDLKSARICEELIQRCSETHKSCSIITNGFGLHLLSAKALSELAWVDVSLDGGPMSYPDYRRGSFSKLTRLVRAALESGLGLVNGLFTLSSATLPFLEDMLAVEAVLDWARLVFSPFATVRSHGKQWVEPLSVSTLLHSLADCASFMNSTKSVLLLGADAGADEGLSFADVEALLGELLLAEKTTHVAHDPLLLGYLRLTYDGFIMTPYQSLHPAEYRATARPLKDYNSLDEAYALLRAS